MNKEVKILTFEQIERSFKKIYQKRMEKPEVLLSVLTKRLKLTVYYLSALSSKVTYNILTDGWRSDSEIGRNNPNVLDMSTDCSMGNLTYLAYPIFAHNRM
jgi:hypothetical protein